MPTRWFIPLLMVALLAAGFEAARMPHPSDGPFPPAPSRARVSSGKNSPWGGYRFVDLTGQPAPDFSLADLHGVRRTLHEQRGKVVMLIFWATWCKTCPLELPQLSAIHRALAPHGLVTLSINWEKDPRRVEQEAHALPFPVLRDPDEKTRRAYDAFSVPRVILVDRSGRIARVIRGYQGTVTPIVQALAEQGFGVPPSATMTRSIPVERLPRSGSP